MVVGVGGALVVGNRPAAANGLEVAQHQIDRSKSANAVAVFNGGNLLVKTAGVMIVTALIPVVALYLRRRAAQRQEQSAG
ncbi:MAG: hypothetical protein R6X32_07205 [Chloroflexota bacterium]